MGDIVTFGAAFNAANQGDFMVIRSGVGFIECINPIAVSEGPVNVTATDLVCHRPQVQFSEYEATIAGDKFVITGTTLNSNNAGTHAIVTVLDRDNVVVTGTLTAISAISLNGAETSAFVQEGINYTGYKNVTLISAQPSSSLRNQIIFNTDAQYNKINESANVSMISLNKEVFPITIKKGLDSYRYNTGLIAEANRIIYGDPRDSTTYPGVGAAGAEIFVREPLTKRIQVSVVVRLATGIPFAQIVEQVRTNVSSLINSNPVGQSIAISAIVSTINTISGVKAVSISSPQYDITHDIIFLSPNEKARVIDSTVDISVSQQGV